jgi:UDP-N-acetylglucosamine diphosphorylase/glucosamine-1-phosphate N-acetyltransferase
MKSDLPKVLHLLGDKSLIQHVLESCRQAQVVRIIVVVGFKGEMVAEVAEAHGAEVVWQKEQLGTAHAVQQTAPLLRDFSGETVVLNGDVPLISPRTIISLVNEHRHRNAAATILTAEVGDPGGYGRIVRDDNGLVERVVEQADADPQIELIHEINSGMFCFDTKYLFLALEKVDNQNRQEEYYLPDVLTILRSRGHPIAAQKVEDQNEILGVNSLEQLKQIARLPVKH